MNTKRALQDLTVTDTDLDRDPAKLAGPAADLTGPAANLAGPAADLAGPAADLAGPAADLAGTDTSSAVTDRSSAVRQGDLPITDIGGAITDSVAPVTDSAGLAAAPGHDATDSVAPVTDIRQLSRLGDIASTHENIAVTDRASSVTDTPKSSRQQTTPSRTSGTASLETTVTHIEQESRNPMNQKHLEKWTPVALNTDAPAEKLRLPFHVLAGEAIDVARFCQRNWEPFIDRAGVEVRPGLKSAIGNGTFSASMPADLLELHDALQTAQTRYRLIVTGSGASLMGSAQALVDDIRSTLEWYFDDGKEDEADAQLAALITTHAHALSHDAMAAALFDFAELADLHRTAVDGLGSFKAAMIDEARALALTLRERSAGSAGLDAVKNETGAYTTFRARRSGTWAAARCGSA
jgi:hypothetical protein